ncbi:MAG: tRNA(Ile)-lysidine synthetase [Bacteroidetes bacterium QH_8_67_23]|nr:MAG: tRNA(Ile)-lysidine synthetase [Bacteroidetes bacterium QH_8_67_23]
MLTDAVRDFIDEHALLPPDGGPVVVGLSGGVDSVALVHLLRRRGWDVAAAHVNYGLRANADDDEAHVVHYCKSFAPPVPLHRARRDPEARAEQPVGHHRDDQAETLLLNLLRGSGPEGLAGMRPKRRLGGEEDGSERAVSLVRPLLAVGRDEIEAYAEAQGLPWREDPSNRDARFKRAALRRDVLPALEAHFSGAADRLARSAALVRQYVDEALRPELRRRFEEASDGEGPDDGARERALAVEALRAAPPVWRGRLLLEGLRRWCPGAPRTQAVAGELEKLLDAQPGRRVDFEAGRVWRERDALRFVQAKEERMKEGERQTLAPGRPACWPGGTLHAERLPTPPESLTPDDPHVALLDAEALALPLDVRPWQPGDRLQPLGMNGRTLVSDLLTNAKVPPSKRKSVRVVCSGDTIVWVVGHRLAESAKVRPSTQRVLRLTFEPSEC